LFELCKFRTEAGKGSEERKQNSIQSCQVDCSIMESSLSAASTQPSGRQGSVATETDDVTQSQKKIDTSDAGWQKELAKGCMTDKDDSLRAEDGDVPDDELDGDEDDEPHQDSEESRLLDAAADFIVLVRDGDLETLKEGVESFGPERASRASTTVETRLGGLTAVTLAAELGNEQIVRLFIDIGADVNGKNATGCWTPLHCAVSQGFPKVGVSKRSSVSFQTAPLSSILTSAARCVRRFKAPLQRLQWSHSLQKRCHSSQAINCNYFSSFAKWTCRAKIGVYLFDGLHRCVRLVISTQYIKSVVCRLWKCCLTPEPTRMLLTARTGRRSTSPPNRATTTSFGCCPANTRSWTQRPLRDTRRFI
jgi:hypothetical protein